MSKLTRETYNKMASHYMIKNKKNLYNNYYERPATISMLPDIDKKLIFDAGCGGGILLEELVKQGADIIACDISEKMIEYARSRLPKYSNKIRIADLTEPLDFIDDNSVDGVVSSLALHYIDDLIPVFTEFNRILKSNGFIVFSTHHPVVDWKWFDQENYFDKKLNSEIWHLDGLDIEVHSYHRTLTNFFNIFNKSGFYVDKLLEPLPVADGEAVNAVSYQFLMRNPHFIIFRLRKIK